MRWRVDAGLNNGCRMRFRIRALDFAAGHEYKGSTRLFLRVTGLDRSRVNSNNAEVTALPCPVAWFGAGVLLGDSQQLVDDAKVLPDHHKWLVARTAFLQDNGNSNIPFCELLSGAGRLAPRWLPECGPGRSAGNLAGAAQTKNLVLCYTKGELPNECNIDWPCKK